MLVLSQCIGKTGAPPRPRFGGRGGRGVRERSMPPSIAQNLPLQGFTFAVPLKFVLWINLRLGDVIF